MRMSEANPLPACFFQFTSSGPASGFGDGVGWTEAVGGAGEDVLGEGVADGGNDGAGNDGDGAPMALVGLVDGLAVGVASDAPQATSDPTTTKATTCWKPAKRRTGPINVASAAVTTSL